MGVREDNDRFKNQRRRVKDVTIAHYEALDDAREDAAILAERGIPSVVVGEEAGRPTASLPDRLPPIRLQVPAGKAFAANQVLRALDPVDVQPADSEELLEDVAFPCEECGKLIALPGDRRGKVETCPRCGAFVDVPRRSYRGRSFPGKVPVATESLCPACQQPMTSMEARGARLHLCTPCGAVWLEGRLIRGLRPVGRDGDPAEALQSPDAVLETSLTCPQCRQTSLVSVARAGHTPHLCAICHGAFVDAGIVNECLGRHCPAPGKEALTTAVTALEFLGCLAELLSGG